MTNGTLWPGLFLAVCGIDGSGKTTQIKCVVDHFAGRRAVLSTRQPTDRYRNDPMVRSLLNLEIDSEAVVRELALLAAFDRARHIRTEILPALYDGGMVVTDRYVYSTYAYFLARGISDVEWLRQLNCLAPEPDATIYIDVPPEIAVERILLRDGSSRKREEIDVARMRQVRAAFHGQPWGRSSRYHVVDGNRPQSAVTTEVLRIVTAAECQ